MKQVLAVLLVLFVIAWAFMFVHPSVTLLLFWVGLIVVGFSTLATRRAHRAEQQAAKAELRAHHCPRCDAPLDRDADSGRWPCPKCGSVFLDSGDESVG